MELRYFLACVRQVRHFCHHKPVYKQKVGLKRFLEFSVLYGSSVPLLYYTVYLHKMRRRNRIPIEHRERIVRAFEDKAEVSC